MDSYGKILVDVEGARWDLGSSEGLELDFDQPFLPESMVHASRLPFLSPRERIVLSQIRAQTYLEIFMLAEKLVVPFVMSRAALALHSNPEQFLALMSFGQQEAKHIVTFDRFARAVGRGLGQSHELRRPADDLTAKILTYHNLAIALVVLHVDVLAETHARCVEQAWEPLEPRMVELLRFHCREEANHVRFDRLIIGELLAQSTQYERERAVQQYVEILDDLRASFERQAELDLCAFESHVRALQPAESTAFRHDQGLSYGTTFLHRGLAHPVVRQTIDEAFGGPFPEVEAARERYRVPEHDDASRACA
ncbi:MAG: diiron oxygenase [Polyangiaceae bacterium]|nr:diiron oxygenase [Polyangiaceae bacterium]